jgi:hypothetical protein
MTVLSDLKLGGEIPYLQVHIVPVIDKTREISLVMTISICIEPADEMNL